MRPTRRDIVPGPTALREVTRTHPHLHHVSWRPHSHSDSRIHPTPTSPSITAEVASFQRPTNGISANRNWTRSPYSSTKRDAWSTSRSGNEGFDHRLTPCCRALNHQTGEPPSLGWQVRATAGRGDDRELTRGTTSDETGDTATQEASGAAADETVWSDGISELRSGDCLFCTVMRGFS